MAAGRVVVAGHCTIDEIHQADGPVLPATPGGAAAYAAIGAVMVGTRVSLVTLLGDDYPFDGFLQRFGHESGIDVSGVRYAAPRSIHNVAWYRADGRRRYDIESWEVMDLLTPDAGDIEPYLQSAGIVLLSPGSLDKQRAMARLARSRGWASAIDTEIHYIEGPSEQRAMREIVGDVSYFLPSIDHLRLLFGCDSLQVETYLGALFGLGCPGIVVKQGADGCTAIDSRAGRLWHLPAVQGLNVRDVTGAGDAFDGGFVAAVADGHSLVDAACWGTVAASFVVESIGAVLPEHFDRALAQTRYDRVRAAVTETVSGRTIERGGW